MNQQETHLKAELHCHTTASDGCFTPAETLAHAQERGINVLAITDHDTFAGYKEARDILAEDATLPLELIPALELTCDRNDQEVHMLGYFVDINNKALNRVLDRVGESRVERTQQIIDKLSQGGFDISSAALKAAGKTMNRSSIARYLASTGQVPTFDYVFDELIGSRKPYFVKREHIDASDGVKLIKDAGGLAVIAHPYHYRVTHLIEPLKKDGLDGVEAYHSEHSPEVAEDLALYGEHLGLLVTGGSDWHGDAVHPADLGSLQVPPPYLQQFLEARPS